MVSGATFGYAPNPTKTFLLVKEEFEENAHWIFNETRITITSSGQSHLGASLGGEDFIHECISMKVHELVSEVEVLSEIGQSYPHEALIAFTNGVSHTSGTTG